ncbi:DUF5623 domain-containing protein [Pseudomonas aeruginosa]|uniref:DUF5623 domain-containing protein n=2 Tax=Pseudomonas TaxID=286 RepID=A0A3M4JUX8_9PSED|nr:MULTISPECIES: DUF5623 domain-containing protein [Pseudomonas]MCT8191174.1 DUF5623 domain-containing protein [Pseudomonas monteilii]MDM3951001.1 DUF5623 domain-containing protein [Pseudomonas alloputida]RMQ20839.1 hypothetical protein ALQ08_200296 [Pseudomonas syringae pv. delphinii]UPL41673.1 DUF5623 domain-containing protein [Pseudomonas aeruginosa]
MATEHTRPTTVARIKRVAKLIKQEKSIPHHAALDEAAQNAGFQNLRHAQSVLGTAQKLHQTFVSFYWKEHGESPEPFKRGPELRSGRTTLSFLLPLPLKDILPGRSLERTAYLSGFRLEAPDHLELRGDAYSKYEGLRMAQQAALTMNFIAATGFRAPFESETYETSLYLSKKADHKSTWYDDDSKCIVILDEPYPPLSREEIDWAQEHGFHTVGIRWRGIYSAGDTPRLHSVSASLIARSAKKLQALEARLQAEAWTYDSQAYDSQFISPARALSGKKKRARIMPPPPGIERDGAVPCGPGEPGFRSRWRPARRMDLDKHLQVGPILENLPFSMIFNSASGLHDVRMTLNKWFEEEYEDAELPDKQVRQDYYSPAPTPIRGAADVLAGLAVLRQTVSDGYQDCKPKKDLLDRLDRSEQWVKRYAARRNR